jgi:uncharacterized membrane protein
MAMPAAQALDIGSTINASWKDFTTHAVPFIVGMLLVALVGGLTLGICLPAMLLGFYEMVLKAARGGTPEIGEVFAGFNRFVPSLILGIIGAIALCLGFLLLVIPGLVVIWLFFWSFFFMAAGENSATACIQKSVDLSKNNVGPTAVFVLVNIIVNGVGNLVPFGGLVTGPVAASMAAHAFLRATEGGEAGEAGAA